MKHQDRDPNKRTDGITVNPYEKDHGKDIFFFFSRGARENLGNRLEIKINS